MKSSNIIQNTKALRSLPTSWKIIEYHDLITDNSGGNKKLLKSDFSHKGKYPVIDQGKELISGFSNDQNFLVKGLPPFIVFGDHTRIFKFIDFPFIMGADGTKVLQSNSSFECDLKYIYYFFTTLNIPDTGYNRHYKYLKSAQIPLPPLETQKKIAEILDAADTLRQKTKTLIEKYDQLTQSLFLDMFGDPVSNPKNWNKKKLKDLVLRLDAGKSIQSVDAKDAGSFKVLKTSAVSWGDFRSWEAKPLPSNYIPPKNHLVRKGDLLLSRMNTTELVGASCYVHKEVSNLALPDRIWKFVWKEKNIDPLFVCHGINKLTFRNEISKISSGTSGSMKNISKEKVLNLDFIYPDYPLQKLFAERVQAIEEQKAKAQASLEKSEELFQSLLQRAFKGELV